MHYPDQAEMGGIKLFQLENYCLSENNDNYAFPITVSLFITHFPNARYRAIGLFFLKELIKTGMRARSRAATGKAASLFPM